MDAHKLGRIAQGVPDHVQPVGFGQLLGLVPLVGGKPYRLPPQASFDLDSLDEDLAGGLISDSVGTDVEPQLQMADPLDSVLGEAFRDQCFNDLVFCGDLALPADIRIEFVGQIGELGLCVGIGSKDKGRPHVLDRSGPGNLKPFQTVEAFLACALKLIYIFPGLVRSKLEFRFGDRFGGKQHGPLLGAVDPGLERLSQVFPANPREMCRSL